jgi:organic hydroperoxide reductase OsmC/OhrA
MAVTTTGKSEEKGQNISERKEHSYAVQVNWTGNLGPGTSGYRAYSRNHEISADGKPILPGSSDPNFRGDPSRYNPEDLLVSSLSACHLLWYLHLCAEAGIVVLEYSDQASGTMVETPDGGGHFDEVVLKPTVLIGAGGDAALAERLHERAHHLCFIANSVNFPVHCRPTVQVSE